MEAEGGGGPVSSLFQYNTLRSVSMWSYSWKR